MKMAGPNGPAIFIFRILGTRTREGFSVKKTDRLTVFRKKSLSGSESQLVCKAQSAVADGESLMVHQTKESIVRYSLWFFVDKGLYPEKQSSHTSTG